MFIKVSYVVCKLCFPPKLIILSAIIARVIKQIQNKWIHLSSGLQKDYAGIPQLTTFRAQEHTMCDIVQHFI
jgi:hypothetical protein